MIGVNGIPLSYVTRENEIPIAGAITLSTAYLGGWNAALSQLLGTISLGTIILLFLLQRIAASNAKEAASSVAKTLHQAAAAYLQYAQTSQPWLESRRNKLEDKLNDQISDLNKISDVVFLEIYAHLTHLVRLLKHRVSGKRADDKPPGPGR